MKNIVIMTALLVSPLMIACPAKKKKEKDATKAFYERLSKEGRCFRNVDKAEKIRFKGSASEPSGMYKVGKEKKPFTVGKVVKVKKNHYKIYGITKGAHHFKFTKKGYSFTYPTKAKYRLCQKETKP